MTVEPEDYSVCFAQSAALQLRCCAPLRDEAMMAGMAMPGYPGHPGQCGYPPMLGVFTRPDGLGTPSSAGPAR